MIKPRLIYGDKAEKRLNTTFQPYPHDHPRAETTEDGSEVHKFRFAFPRGTLDRRMSAKELSEFVLQHIIATLNMRLLDFTDFVCPCGWRSRLQPEDTVCPVCNHKCTTAPRTEIQAEFNRILEAFVNVTIQLLEVDLITRKGDLVKGILQVKTFTLSEKIDELVPWAKVTRAGTKSPIPGQPMDSQDYIELNLHDHKPWEEKKLIFDVGAGQQPSKEKLHNDLVKSGTIVCPTHSSILKGNKN